MTNLDQDSVVVLEDGWDDSVIGAEMEARYLADLQWEEYLISLMNQGISLYEQ